MHDSIIQRRGYSRRLRLACRSAFAAACLIFCCHVATAQSYPNNLSADSITPDMDAQFIRKVRHQMDSIHRNCHRPTVAVVLSGGGAKGAAEAGALKFLEEQKIPVDFICGTSIGGLIGGLYAVGYKADDIHELFCTQDWGVTLTDRIESKYYSFKTKQYNSTYLISIPFKYEDEDFFQRVLEQEEYEYERSDAAEAGRRGDMNSQKGVNNLSNSLPSGYVYGFNVNNLLAALTVGYQDDMSFADLPIPYACVASDMVSCKAKNWGRGTLKTAMRSTMSIPGLFDPVREEGMVLVDGGTRNNFPTDIAKAVGADYIIGIELSDVSPTFSQLNNVGGLLGQFIKMLGKDSFDRNYSKSDVIIKPELVGFNMLSFNPEAVDTMVLRGYRAAQQQESLISEIKSVVPEASTNLRRRAATDIRSQKVMIKSVAFDGVTDEESLILQKMIKLSVGSLVGDEEMKRAMSIVQSTGVFEQVTYSLLGREAPYDLVFNCRKGPVHQLGLGLRMDTEEWVSLALNVGLNAHKLSGPKLDFNAKIGSSQKASLKFFTGSPGHPAINAEVAGAHYSGQVQSFYDSFIQPTAEFYRLRTDAEYWTHKEMIYVQQMMWKRLNLQAGVKNQNYSLSNQTVFGYLLNQTLLGNVLSGDYVGAFVNSEIYTMDDKFYPSKGLDFKLNYNGDFLKLGVPSYTPIHSLGTDLKFVIPFGSKVALIPDLHVRLILNDNELFDDQHQETPNPAFSFSHFNWAGGSMAGRYIENQVPFFGINRIFYTDDQLATATAELRIRAAKNFYLSLLGGALKDGTVLTDLVSFDEGMFDYAFGFETGYNTIMGPAKLNVHWDKRIGWGAYFSLGYDF